MTTPSSSDSTRRSTGQDIDAGTLLGKYRVVRRIGQGGMGEVFEAEDTKLHRLVAIKVLPSLAADDELRDRFRREALAAARLNHQNVVQIYDSGSHAGSEYLVLELVQGRNAQQQLEEHGAFPWAEATRIISDVCAGVVAAHVAGLIHRDIKPGNLILTSQRGVKLADFGLARLTDPGAASLTATKEVLGTPLYMSPEQCRGERVDERTDIYSLGATYFALLTGRPPYAGELPVHIMFAHCSHPVPDPRKSRPDIPAACASIVTKAMAKEPSDRYANAAEMQADLAAAGDGAPRVVSATAAAPTVLHQRAPGTRARWLPWAVAGALVLVLAAFAFHGPPERKASPSTPAQPDAAPSMGVPSLATAPPPRPFRAAVRERDVDIVMESGTLTVAFSPDGTLFAAGNYEAPGGVVVWDVESGDERLRKWPGMHVHCVAFSPDSKMLAAAGVGDIRLWDFAKGQETRIPTGGESVTLCSVTFSRDGRKLAAGRMPKEGDQDPSCVMIVDLASGTASLVPGQNDWVWSVSFSPDGRLLASGAQDGKVQVLEFPELTVHKELQTDLKISGVAFTPRGDTLAATASGTILSWDTATWAEKRVSLKCDDVYCLRFARDGTRVAVGIQTGKAKVLTWPSCEELATIEGCFAEIYGMAFTPDDSVLALACMDKVIRVREVSRLVHPH